MRLRKLIYGRINGNFRTNVKLSVEFSLPNDDGFIRQVEATREIIVSCAAIGSPLLLMRSGIGDKNELEKHGIECLVNNPNVGRNLEDHLAFFTICPAKQGKESDLKSVNKKTAENLPGAFPALHDWILHGNGPLASSALDTQCFFRTGLNLDMPFPDAQIQGFVSPGHYDLWFNNIRIPPEDYIPQRLLADDGEGFIFVNTLLHPKSKGYIELTSKDPQVHPKIHANYLLEEEDLDTLVAICLKSVDIAKNMDLLGPPVIPKDLQYLPLESKELWAEMCRRYATTLYHPTSTCKMGLVCNSDLTVKGVTGLRIADASVMPHIVSGNTNCPSIMIGERAADFIASTHRLSLGGLQPEKPQIFTMNNLLLGTVALAAGMKLISKM